MLVVNSLTAIANNITPNTFLIMLIPFLPIKRSIFEEVFKTTYINRTFKINATIIFSILNSARKDKSVVKLPGPAINGNAKGKTDAVMPPSFSSLYSVIPNIISRAIKNRINAPATAKELTPIPINDNKLLPKKRNIIIMTPAIIDAFSL